MTSVSIPACTAFQYLILRTIADGEKTIREIRTALDESDAFISPSNLSQLIIRMGDKDWIIKPAEGRCQITAAGRKQIKLCQSFYQ